VPARSFSYPIIALLIGCGAAAPAPAVEPEPGPSPLGDLPLLVPAGAELIVVARPAELHGSSAVRRVSNALVPDAFLEAFSLRNGVDPREVTEAVFAEYEHGFLLIVRGPWPASDVVRAAEQRMNTIEASADVPFVRRVGYLGTERRDLIALRDDVLVVASGVAEELAPLLTYAGQGRWPEGLSRALDTADGRALRPGPEGLPLVLYSPEPLDLPAGYGTSLLLGRQRPMAVRVSPADSEIEALALEVELLGEFPEGAERNFRTLLESIGRTPLGGALGIAEAARTLSVQVDDRSAVLRFNVPSSTLGTGLHVLFVAELRDLFGEPPHATPQAP
jgi:hypothetical protein